MPPTTIDKLNVLLPHWQSHNRGHADEFKQWAAKARAEGEAHVAALLEQSAANLSTTGDLLREAAVALGVPDEAHDNEHGHSHAHRHPHPHDTTDE